MAGWVTERKSGASPARVVDAHAPLSTLFGDVPGLRGLSRGRANATMHFAHHAVVPAAIAAQIVNA